MPQEAWSDKRDRQYEHIRGGLRSHHGPGGRTKAQLYAEARRRNIRGRSKMTKAQLERAVGR